MKQIVAFLCFITCFYSCNDNKKQVTFHIDPEDESSLLSFIEDVSLTPISTDIHFSGQEADLLVSTKDYIITDKENRRVLRFDQTGNFLNQIGTFGNGPEEYRSIKNVQLLGDKVAIYSLPNTTVLYYQLDGDFLNREYHEINGMQIATVKEGLLAFQGYGSTDKCIASLLTKDGNLKRLCPYSSDVTAFLEYSPVFSFNKESVFVRNQLDHIIYKYCNGRMDPYLVLDFGHYGLSSSFYNLDYLESEEFLIEHDCYMITRFEEKGPYRLVEITKSLSNKVTYGLCINGAWIWFSMGIIGKDPFAGSIKAIDGDNLICLVNASLLQNMGPRLKDKIVNKDSFTTIQNTDKDVIIRIHIKDNPS